MHLAELIERVKALPKDKRAEVYDFVEFLVWRESLSPTAREQEHADWSEADFSAMAMQQALRSLEDENALRRRRSIKRGYIHQSLGIGDRLKIKQRRIENQALTN